MCEIICKKCSRVLKTIKSIELGFGPTCYKNHKKELADKEFEKNQITIYQILGEEK